MTPLDVVLKTVAVHVAGRTRYLPLDSIPLDEASTVVLAARVDRGMDDSGEHEQIHLHLSLRIEATIARPHVAPTARSTSRDHD